MYRAKEPVNLYLDQETRDAFTKEASRVGLTFSAYVRVLGRGFKAWADSKPGDLMTDLREKVRTIIIEESRRV